MTSDVVPSSSMPLPRHVTIGAEQLIATVLDPGSFRPWDSPPPPVADPAYAATLATARAHSGVDEAVLTGRGRIGGRPVAVLCGEFGFLGGSIGAAAADRLVAAIERATGERLPLLAATASGGTRMQEGTLAFLRMASITAAITAHKAAGLPYLVYLRHPTTGGVFASWGSLGHLTVAEPGALVGFLGPKVSEALRGEPFPAGVQTAEHLHAHGVLDAVLPIGRLAEVTGRVLALLDPTEPSPASATAARPATALHTIAAATQPAPPSARPAPEPTAWQSVTRSRRPGRPGAREVLRAATDVVPLAGTGAGERGDGLLLALARFGGTACVLVGQDRRARRPLGPGALRTARRGMRLAGELGLPLVTLIDTAGAELSAAAEEGALAGEIARCVADLLALPVPTLAVLLGQGAGGAALALLPADRVLAAWHGWLGPLPPEGAAVIQYGDAGRAAEMAAAQGIRSQDLLRAGAVDRLVPELPDAADEPEAFVARLTAMIDEELRAPRATSFRPDRAARFHTLGGPGRTDR
ncbi:MAG TPA: carboxyl transferase domain-containing protein [Pseudonocardia sp.]|nr:carboxyl transferase domain-containing protein [Pseudonocardia sp.]